MTYSLAAETVTLSMTCDEYRALLAVLQLAAALAKDFAISPEITGMINSYAKRLHDATGGDLALYAMLPEEKP